jgi:hypothetical protein
VADVRIPVRASRVQVNTVYGRKGAAPGPGTAGTHHEQVDGGGDQDADREGQVDIVGGAA